MSIQEEIDVKNNMDFITLQMNRVKIPRNQLSDLAAGGFEVLLETFKTTPEIVTVYSVEHLNYVLHYATEFEEYELCTTITNEINSRQLLNSY